MATKFPLEKLSQGFLLLRAPQLPKSKTQNNLPQAILAPIARHTRGHQPRIEQPLGSLPHVAHSPDGQKKSPKLQPLPPPSPQKLTDAQGSSAPRSQTQTARRKSLLPQQAQSQPGFLTVCPLQRVQIYLNYCSFFKKKKQNKKKAFIDRKT